MASSFERKAKIVFRDPFNFLHISLLVKPLSCEIKIEKRRAIDLFSAK